MKNDPFETFRTLLNKTYIFPAIYPHKFIGKNSPIFLQSVLEFEQKFIGLKRTGQNMSASNNHLALTYEYLAASADDIILLTQETSKINDLIYML